MEQVVEMIDRNKEIIFNIIDLVLQDSGHLSDLELETLTELGYSSEDISFFYLDELNSILSLSIPKGGLIKEITNMPLINKIRVKSIKKFLSKGR